VKQYQVKQKIDEAHINKTSAREIARPIPYCAYKTKPPGIFNPELPCWQTWAFSPCSNKEFTLRERSKPFPQSKA